MGAKSKESKHRDQIFSALNVSIDGLDLAEKLSIITPAKAAFGTVGVVLKMIRDTMINEEEFVELGFICTSVCATLDRGSRGKPLNELGGSVADAVGQLKITVEDIRNKVDELSKRTVTPRFFHASTDSRKIDGWKEDLNRILLIFISELGLNMYVTLSETLEGVTEIRTVFSNVQHGVADTHNVVEDIQTLVSNIFGMLKSREEADDQRQWNQASTSGESPPPAPRACFGRAEFIDKIVDLAENLKPIALIGVGGIGKTSIALTLLHHDRIKQRFGVNRRFIHCDQFPTSCAHLLSRLSKVVGAGMENPEDLASLRPFLSSREMLIVFDNAESILDPEGANSEAINAVMEELSQFDNICLCITSRISVVPTDCETFDIQPLSIDAARDAFYRIYKSTERPDLVDAILEQLDFHPLSITLLATVAHQNKWNMDRLQREWERQRTRTLQTTHDKSFAKTIELSLACPMFQEITSDARGLLEAVAFFPQGVDENNLDWLFPTIPDGINTFDKFCALSLTHRSDSFVTMLAPLRDHLRPRDPKSSSLLHIAKEKYFTRMSVDLNPNRPALANSGWIALEDLNVEYLLDVFATIDADPSVWDTCAKFIDHLAHHKQRPTVLGPKIEGLPDSHPSKPRCLFQLARLFKSFGNHVECKRLLTCALKLQRQRGNRRAVALTLRRLSEVNRILGFREEGIRLAEESLQLYKQFKDVVGQAGCSLDLARLFYGNKWLDAAEEAASRTIDLLSERSERFMVCESHRLLGNIYRSRGETEKPIHHLEIALGLASSHNWTEQLFWIHREFVELFLDRDRFDDAQTHIERAKLHTGNRTFFVGHTVKLQARLLYRQHRLEEAKSEALRAADIFEKLGATNALEGCRPLLRRIEGGMNKPVVPEGSTDNERPAQSK